MKKKILIGTATYNECKNITRLVSDIFNQKIDLKVLVIDDNSPDGTNIILKKLNKKYKNKFNFIVRKKKLGLDTAHKLIYKHALKKKFDYLITMDADLSHDPKEISKILYQLKFNEFVIGSRYMKGGKCKMKKSRLLLSKFGNLIIKNILKSGISEHTTSFRGFDLKKLSKKGFDFQLVKSKGYSFFMETIFHLKNKNSKIKEIPITFKDRKYGNSKIPRIEIFRTLINLFLIKCLNLSK